jgi:hypothetical protein
VDSERLRSIGSAADAILNRIGLASVARDRAIAFGRVFGFRRIRRCIRPRSGRSNDCSKCLVTNAFGYAKVWSETLMTQYRTVDLPEDLCAAGEKLLAGRFENLEALLSFLLQEIVKDDAAKFDRAEEQMIEQRLKDLGYI